MVAMTFDANSVVPSTGAADIFETGEYGFQIVDSATQDTKNKNGVMLVLTLACIDPEQAGKRLVVRLNIQNPNPQTVEIAMRDLSAICHVTGVMHFSDTQQLHGKPFRARVEKSPRNDDPTKFGNEVKAYMDMQGNAPGGDGTAMAGGAAAPAAPAAPVAPAAPAAAAAAPAAAPVAAPAAAAAPAAPNPAAPPAAAPVAAPAAPVAAAAPAAPVAGAEAAPAAAPAAPAGTPPWGAAGA